MKYSHVLWDFNGTVLNDVSVGVESANELLKRHGLPLLCDEDAYRKIFCFPIIEYYRKLGFDFNKNPYDELAVEWVEIYNNTVYKATLYDGIIQLLTSVKNTDTKQLILSATELKMLNGQLKFLGVLDFFDEVLGTGDIYAYSKKDIAVNWVKVNKPTKAVLIGDTTHDKEVADAAGFDCILVSYGHGSREKLLASGSIVVDSVSEVSKLIF